MCSPKMIFYQYSTCTNDNHFLINLLILSYLSYCLLWLVILFCIFTMVYVLFKLWYNSLTILNLIRGKVALANDGNFPSGRDSVSICTKEKLVDYCNIGQRNHRYVSFCLWLYIMSFISVVSFCPSHYYHCVSLI